MAFGAADAHMGAGEAGGVFQEWSSEFHERGSTQGEDNFSQRVFKVQALASFGSLNDSDQPVDDRPGWLMRRVLFRGDARAREFTLHGAACGFNGAVEAVSGIGCACFARPPALCGKRRERRFQRMRQIACAASRQFGISLPGIGQGVDRLCKRRSLGWILLFMQSRAGVALHFRERRTHLVERLEAKPHLDERGRRKHRPQHNKKDREIARELRARRGDRRVIGAQHHQNVAFAD